MKISVTEKKMFLKENSFQICFFSGKKEKRTKGKIYFFESQKNNKNQNHNTRAETKIFHDFFIFILFQIKNSYICSCDG